MFESIKPHLVELRTRLTISVASVFIMFAVAFMFHNSILTWVTAPLNNALTQVGKIIDSKSETSWKIQPENNKSATLEMFIIESANSLHDSLSEASLAAQSKLSKLLLRSADAAQKLQQLLEQKFHKEHTDKFEGKITTNQVGGAFFVALKVSIFAALIMALPVILWQLWLFIAPGLYENEKRLVVPFVFGGTVMFLIGVLFAYYVVTPFGFQFLITFGSFLYTPFINIEDYVGFFTKILMGFGMAFELPVLASFLGIMGLVTDKSMIGFFKYAVVIIFILAALLTPPDVLTQLLMAAPLIILYGASIVLLKFINPYNEEE